MYNELRKYFYCALNPHYAEYRCTQVFDAASSSMEQQASEFFREVNAKPKYRHHPYEKPFVLHYSYFWPDFCIKYFLHLDVQRHADNNE